MKEIYHANVIVGREDYRHFVYDILLKNLNFDIKANPDFLLVEREFLGIDDARNLERWIMGKPLINETKVSFILVKSITSEAQNALLKVLEEPPVGTYIFINLESLGGLLPTFLSRVRILNTSSKGVFEMPRSQKAPFDEAHKFLVSNVKEKLALTRFLSKKGDKTPMKELIKNLEEISYENYAKKITNNVTESKAMKNILTAKIFASTRGSSPKMLLEWLSCVL